MREEVIHRGDKPRLAARLAGKLRADRIRSVVLVLEREEAGSDKDHRPGDARRPSTKESGARDTAGSARDPPGPDSRFEPL